MFAKHQWISIWKTESFLLSRGIYSRASRKSRFIFLLFDFNRVNGVKNGLITNIHLSFSGIPLRKKRKKISSDSFSFLWRVVCIYIYIRVYTEYTPNAHLFVRATNLSLSLRRPFSTAEIYGWNITGVYSFERNFVLGSRETSLFTDNGEGDTTPKRRKSKRRISRR